MWFKKLFKTKENISETLYTESKECADKIYKEYFCKPSKESICTMAIQGKWGSGKTTIKGFLLNSINKSHKPKAIITDFNALQFEENGQITSELYYSIAKSISGPFWLWFKCPLDKYNRCRLKNKFNAIAYLKKESASHSISVNLIVQFIFSGLVLLWLTKIIKLPFFNNLSSHIPHNWGITTQNPMLGNKLILLSFGILILYWSRHWLVKAFSARLPRASHVDILSKLRLRGFELVVSIDELDRLSPDSMKLLLDELITIKQIFLQQNTPKKAHYKNKCCVLLFFDMEVVTKALKDKSILHPTLYLQKHFDYRYDIRYSPLNEIIILLKKYANNEESYDESNSLQALAEYINLYIQTFRDVERLENYLTVSCIQKIDEHVLKYNQNSVLYKTLGMPKIQHITMLIFKIAFLAFLTKEYEKQVVKEDDSSKVNSKYDKFIDSIINLISIVSYEFYFRNIKTNIELIENELNIAKEKLEAVKIALDSINKIYNILIDQRPPGSITVIPNKPQPTTPQQKLRSLQALIAQKDVINIVPKSLQKLVNEIESINTIMDENRIFQWKHTIKPVKEGLEAESLSFKRQVSVLETCKIICNREEIQSITKNIDRKIIEYINATKFSENLAEVLTFIKNDFNEYFKDEASFTTQSAGKEYKELEQFVEKVFNWKVT